MLERGDQVGQTWANLYDSLVLHTAKRLSALPGLAFPSATPLFPTARDFLDYLQQLRRARSACRSRQARSRQIVRRDGGAGSSRTATGAEIEARAVVVATGIVVEPAHAGDSRARPLRRSCPSQRRIPPAGRDPGASACWSSAPGNSAGEISVELARAGADVTLAVRTGATVVPREIAGHSDSVLQRRVGVAPPSRAAARARSYDAASARARARPARAAAAAPRRPARRCR